MSIEELRKENETLCEEYYEIFGEKSGLAYEEENSIDGIKLLNKTLCNAIEDKKVKLYWEGHKARHNALQEELHKKKKVWVKEQMTLPKWREWGEADDKARRLWKEMIEEAKKLPSYKDVEKIEQELNHPNIG